MGLGVKEAFWHCSSVPPGCSFFSFLPILGCSHHYHLIYKSNQTNGASECHESLFNESLLFVTSAKRRGCVKACCFWSVFVKKLKEDFNEIFSKCLEWTKEELNLFWCCTRIWIDRKVPRDVDHNITYHVLPLYIILQVEVRKGGEISCLVVVCALRVLF